MKRNILMLLAGMIALFLLHGCGGSSSDDPTPESTFTLQLLHYADVDGGGTLALENVDTFSALVAHFRAEMPNNTLLVSSGDNYIPGPIYQASNEPVMDALIGRRGVGRGEIAIMNALGLAVTAVGNHDLDGGPAEFAGIIGPDDRGWEGSRFPWLAANLDFSTDSAVAPLITADGQEAATIPGRLAASAVVTVDGERIGLVGAVTPTLSSITSTGNITVKPDSTDLDALAAEIQPAVDALTAQGIDKIILLAHMQQIAVEKGLATRLNDVDIIVAGGSNTILADGNDILQPGDTAADFYPLQFTSPEGDPVLLVNTDGDYKYLGRLVVTFDAAGRIIPDSLDPASNGAWAALDSIVNMLNAEPVPQVVVIADTLRGVLESKDGNVAGFTDVFLEGRRSFVRSEETNLGNLTADANLWYARRADPDVVIALKNGGGIRAPIGRIIAPPGSTDVSEVELLPPQANTFKPEGGVSQLDIETSLAFNNGLTLLSLTAAELWDLMERTVASAAPGATPGSFPQIGGLRIAFDPERPARSGDDFNQGAATTGQRIRDLLVGLPDGTVDVVVANGQLQGSAGRTFRLVTLNFLASCVPDTSGQSSADCGDGYPFKGLINPNRRDLATDFAASVYDPGLLDFADSGSEQDALAEFLAAFHGTPAAAFDLAETPVTEDTRIINLGARDNPLAP